MNARPLNPITRWLAAYGLKPRATTVQRAVAPLLEGVGA